MLQFADDTLFICKAQTNNIVLIKSILKINFHETKIDRRFGSTTAKVT